MINTKKLLLSTILLVMISCFQNANAWRVVGRSANGGGLFGYDYVSWSLVTYSDDGETKTGANVVCKHPGFHHCPRYFVKPTVEPPIEDEGTTLDAIDVKNADLLLEFGYKEIASGNATGNKSIRVQVAGENVIRIYTLQWSCDHKGQESITVDRNDVKI